MGGFFLRRRGTMHPISSATVDQLTRALGEAVVRTWSHLPQEVQNQLFEEAVSSQGESIRPQLAVFLHDKHPRTADPLGKPRENDGAGQPGRLTRLLVSRRERGGEESRTPNIPLYRIAGICFGT